MSGTNVLFITLDQWRADFLGYTGNDLIKTPHLDALCADSVTFHNHYTCSAPCGPSRATLHTGMYPNNHRSIQNGTPLDSNLTNLAIEARKAGYDPTLFGGTDTTMDPRYVDHKDASFNTYENVLPGYTVGAKAPEHSRPWLAYLKSKGYDVKKLGYSIYDPDPEFSLPADRHSTYAPTVFKAEHSDTSWLTDQVIDYLTLSDNKPFFHHVTYLRPHPPFIAPAEYHDMYSPADMKPAIRKVSATEEAENHPFMKLALDRIKQKGFFNAGDGLVKDLTDEEILQIRATYCALVTEADANIGRLIQELKDQGKYDNTLIIVTSDHGEQLGDHYLFGKLGYFDQSFHIPLIIKSPHTDTTSRGVNVKEFTESIDIAPTILDYIGLSVPTQCDGLSLAPFVDGAGPEKWRDAVHWLYDFRDPKNKTAEKALSLPSNACNLVVYRDHKYKYVHFADLPPLLFDIENDPEELANLAENPDYATTLLEYTRKMLSWRLKNENSTLDGYHASSEGLVFSR